LYATYVYTPSEESLSSCECCLSRCVLWCRAQRNPPSRPIAAKTKYEEKEEEVKVEKSKTEEEEDRMKGIGNGGRGGSKWRMGTSRRREDKKLICSL